MSAVIDFSRTLTGLDGLPLMNGEKPLTLVEVCTNALLGQFPDEQSGLPMDEKQKRFKLALKIFTEGNIEIDSEEAVLLKKVVNKGYSTLIVGQVMEIIK